MNWDKSPGSGIAIRARLVPRAATVWGIVSIRTARIRRAGGGRFKDNASNMMCQQPPWGQLTAVNVNTGEFAWRVPLGITESLPPEKQKTGRPGNGGTIATAGGLIFIGAKRQPLRAFDAKTGKELWTFTLAGAAQATPMTYEGRDGRQYVVIAPPAAAFSAIL
jgi:quinoprotein glucose dehydrogenase